MISYARKQVEKKLMYVKFSNFLDKQFLLFYDFRKLEPDLLIYIVGHLNLLKDCS